MNKKRDYASEYRKYHATEEQKKKRAARNKARREMEKKVGKSALKNKDVDHKKPLRSGGSTSASNTRVRSKSANRADNGGKGYGRGRPKGSTTRKKK